MARGILCDKGLGLPAFVSPTHFDELRVWFPSSDPNKPRIWKRWGPSRPDATPCTGALDDGYLGIKFDPTMTFHAQITKLVKEGSRRVNRLQLVS